VHVLGVLEIPLPWWVTGPGLGLCVVALYGLVNARLGVSGAWLAVLAWYEGWHPERWRFWFLGALVAGSATASVLGPSQSRLGYGRLSEQLGPGALVPLLLGGGIALGFGARWAGGCGSAHGLSGAAAGSRDSLVVAGTALVVAVVVALVLHAVTGGVL
jgi:hypothetical protein